jgi:signal transduction histidine kinase/ActR/RegA family two-component response regulator
MSPSPPPEAPLQLHPVTLAFAGPWRFLEERFWDEQRPLSAKESRIKLVMAAALFGSFAVLDWLVMPPAAMETAWQIRFLVVCPALLLTAVLSLSRRCQRLLPALSAGLALLTGGGIIAMILVAPPAVGYVYYAGLITIFIYAYGYLPLPFTHASIACWTLVLGYEATALLVHTPLTVLVTNNFFFITSNVVGMLACHKAETALRRDYFLRHRLEESERKALEANQELERRVRERTAALEQANRGLHSEIERRQAAETERQQLEGHLRQAQKLEVVGNLAAGVAHDLNNILTALVIYPDMILEELPAGSELREPIVSIQQAGRRAAAVVQDLLTMARRGVVETRVCSLNQLVAEFLRSPEWRRLQLDHPHVRLEVDLSAGLFPVLGSPAGLMKSLTNLVTNAAEATLVEGCVTVRTENRYLDKPLQGLGPIPEGEYVVLSVEDTGIGISAEDLPRLFEPFFTKKKMGRSGTGLGMTVVATTVKDMGGHLDASSREGEGSRFSLYLPASRLAAQEEPLRPTLDDCRGTERILVVDDVPEQREIARRVLGKLGYAVTAMPGGEEAVAFLREHEVDLLVLDMVMDPGIDGCETYRRALEVRPGLPALIASGFAESERVREVQALGAGRYLRKPYTLEQLGLGVRAELSRARRRALLAPEAPRA